MVYFIRSCEAWHFINHRGGLGRLFVTTFCSRDSTGTGRQSFTVTMMKCTENQANWCRLDLVCVEKRVNILGTIEIQKCDL